MTVFDEHRNLLFRVAYDMLGSVSDAEDVVQDTWLRWSRVEDGHIANPRAYLVRIAARQALDRLRSARASREHYVGPWLPEPLLATPDPAEDVAEAEDVTLGLLVVLETLSPPERAVFVLREAFGYEYGEIAEILDRSSTAVRQLAHRARQHVQARRPRFTPHRDTARAVADRFLNAALGGSVTDLLETLAPDVTLYNDGGGKARAALRPIHGADKVARLLATVGPRYAPLRRRWVRGGAEPTVLLLTDDDTPAALLALEADATSGQIARVYGVVNPDKLVRRRTGAP